MVLLLPYCAAICCAAICYAALLLCCGMLCCVLLQVHNEGGSKRVIVNVSPYSTSTICHACLALGFCTPSPPS